MKKGDHNFGWRVKATRKEEILLKKANNKGKVCEKSLRKKGKNKGKYNMVDQISELPVRFSPYAFKEAASTRNLCRRRSYMPKRKKKILGNGGKNKGEFNLVDRISGLPDEILFGIVSLLPLKEAAATSILSKRWQYVWAFTMNLNFDAKYGVGPNFPDFVQLKSELKTLEIRRYIDWVNTVVDHHRSPTIERFRACFELNSCSTSSIDKWIQFALNKRVQILELEFGLSYFHLFTAPPYQFPRKLLGLKNYYASKLNNMHYDSPTLHSCGYNIGFKFLKVLHFRCVDVTEEVLEYFMSNCPVLERLSVTVNRTTNLVDLRVVGPSIALKYLEINSCEHLKSIEICDVDLVSFIYHGREINLLVNKVPLLVEVSISERVDFFEHKGLTFGKSIELPLTQLSCCLSQLEVLMLDIDGAVYNVKPVFPILANLKHLELLVQADYYRDLAHLRSFMKASPYLQRLVLKLNFKYSRDISAQLDYNAKCLHPNLKVVEIVGFRARRCAAQHVMYLIKNAVALEKIVIDPVQRWLYPSTRFPNETDRGVEVVKAEVKAREHAVQHLKEKVPSTIEFVCL